MEAPASGGPDQSWEAMPATWPLMRTSASPESAEGSYQLPGLGGLPRGGPPECSLNGTGRVSPGGCDPCYRLRLPVVPSGTGRASRPICAEGSTT